MSVALEPDARVMTPDGIGRVVETYAEERWLIGRRPVRRVWSVVDLEHGGRKTFDAEELEPLVEFPP